MQVFANNNIKIISYCMERADTAQIQELRKLIETDSIQDHNQIQALASELFKANPQDLDYKLCYIIACLKNNHLNELANIFKVAPTSKDPEDYQIAYGYYLYIKEDYQKAIKYLLELNQTYRVRLLLSQCYFKGLDYNSSSSTYTDLVKEGIKNKNQQGDNESLIVNLLASLSGSNANHSKLLDDLGISKREDKESLFNLAQVYHSGDKSTSLDYIRKFQNSLKLPDDEEDRIASLLLSDYLRYGNQMEVESEKVREYTHLNQHQYKQANLDVVISNNLAVLKERATGQYSNELLKQIEELLGSKSKQTRQQILILKINKFILLLRKNRLNEAQKVLKDIESNYHQQQTQIESFVKGKLFLFIKNSDEKQIFNLLSKGVSNKLFEFLLRVQYLRESKQLNQIFNEYKKSSKEILNNEIISKYTIALALKDEKIFENQLEELNTMAIKSNDVRLMKLLVQMHKNKGDTIKTTEVLERILKVNPKDEQARLTMAQIRLNEGNIQAAEDLLRNFQKPQQIIDMNHLQALENNIHFSITKVDASNKIEAITKLKKRIKKKKIRYPKGFDLKKPGPPPNPERWLPKYERKEFKKKKNFKSGRTQGAAVGKESVNTYTGGNTTSNLNVNTGKGKRRKN